jgi:hypothetical protein
MVGLSKETVTNGVCTCRIWGSHSGNYECCHLLGYSTMKFVCELTFRWDISPPSSGSKISRARNQCVAGSSCWFLAWLIFPEDGGDTFHQNVSSHTDYTVLYPRRWQQSVCIHFLGCLWVHPTSQIHAHSKQILQEAVKSFSLASFIKTTNLLNDKQQSENKQDLGGYVK